LFETTPFLSMSRKLGKIKTFNGGYKLVVPVETKVHSQVTVLDSGWEALDLSVQDFTEQAEYDWTRIAIPVLISGREEAENSGDKAIIDLGGRELEVLHVPGHTPDAIALLDAEAGYLWTGDSFYEGPIWLFAPETDLARYEASVARMAALVPRLTRVFPAHNTPTAEPVRLLELRDVLEAVRNGTLEGAPGDGGMMRYEAGAFSLLMRAPEAGSD